MTVYTTDMPLMKTAGVEVLRELWDDSVPPVTIIGVASLWFEGMHIEVDAQALIR